jgi:predicted DNA-binding transcriptional regulator AlpA
VTTPIRRLTKKEVLAIVGISHVTLWDWIRQGRFPAPVVIGPEGGARSTIGWIDTEVYNFMANSPRRHPRGSTVTR